MTLRVVVVDDEPLPRQRVRDLVSQHPSLTFVGEARNGTEALDVLVDLRPDLAFLDIQMPELDGLQVAASLADDAPPAIVFVTAFDEYAIRAFEVDAIDYLLKPVTLERFTAAVERVLKRLDRPEESVHGSIQALATRIASDQGFATRFVARRGSKHYFVRAGDVDWIEAVGNYVRLQTGDMSHLVRETMKNMEARLDPAHFVRIHRSAIVSIDRIQSIEVRDQGEYFLTMANVLRLVSSRGYSERVRGLLR
ncbi:MAG: LytR/AlgR family response regulator transcription factor [Gemmatimonadaceae bacterium]